MKGNRTIAAGAALLAVAVMLGAFGAHALKERMAPEQLDTWRTAVEYHFYHALGLLLLGLIESRVGQRAARWSASFLLAGIVLFCGSLYLLSTKDLLGLAGAARWLGPSTPLGGLCFIAGWAVLFVSALRKVDVR
jgi:uncharacterized membrane protein YgdD (TMEM256/DUF423 family)